MLSTLALEVASSPDLTGAFQTGLSNIQSDVMGYVAIAVPVVLVIVGTFFAIKKAIGFFRSAAKG